MSLLLITHTHRVTCKRVPSLRPCRLAHAPPLLGSPAAGAPGLHAALQLPTACGVSRWCKIPREVPQAHWGVGPHACSPCPPPSTAREGCDAAGQLLAVAHQALAAAVSTHSKVSPPVTICCVSFLLLFQLTPSSFQSLWSSLVTL